MGEAKRRAEKRQKAMQDRGVVGVALLRFIDSAVGFGLPPIEAVRAMHHALASTTAKYFGESGASFIEEYGAALPALVTQYAEAMRKPNSPLIVMPDGSPAIAANESETKH